MTTIHNTAIVDTRAELAAGVEVGAYSVIGPKVRIGAGTRIGPHCVITGNTTIGADNRIFQFSSIGDIPQDMKYQGEDTLLIIGDRNTIREGCTINTGTVQDIGKTVIGSDNWIMAYVHVAHDCVLGDHVIIANYTGLAGHVRIDDWVVLGGQCGVYQRVRLGAHSMCGFQSHVGQDVPPFVTADGNPFRPVMVNQEGLKRRGFSTERIARIKQVYRLLYRKGSTLAEAMGQIGALHADDADGKADIALMLNFLQDNLDRGRAIVR